ncbi:MAG: hypothetical protein QMC98_01840 [Candidatus Thermoplasmatota archaeon]|nr:hypothetical protein [Candidatus Thermoplasmatota archaeon]
MRKAQIHVIETALGALVFIVAILFIGSFRAPLMQQSYSQQYLKTLGNDALRSFDIALNITDASKYHNSNLTYVIFGPNGWNETGKEGNFKWLLDFLDNTLKNISYNLYLRSSTTITLLYLSDTPMLSTISASRSIVYEGTVYEVELLLW